MKKAFEGFINLFEKNKTGGVQPGIYNAEPDPEINVPYRMHLRVETDGTGILILNASTILHLNQSAMEYAYAMLTGMSDQDAAKKVASLYSVDIATAEADYKDFKQRISTLIHTPDLDPVTYLDFERREPYSGAQSAPYRLDCALTYRVREAAESSAALIERVDRELETKEWYLIFEKAWNIGIPHIIFTGGEPTLREDLPDLIDKAENLGLVTGLMTDGKSFTQKDHLSALISRGLDHITIIADPVDSIFWQSLENIMKEDIHVTVHLTVTRNLEWNIDEVFSRLSSMSVRAISLSMVDSDAQSMLQIARQTAAEMGLRLIWDLPVPYSRFHPVTIEAAEFGETLPEGTGRAWMYIEPDGDVLPAQGINRVLGNLLKDEWQIIAAKR